MDVLQNYRKEIDAVDNEIVRLLGKRMGVIRHIRDHKRKNNLMYFDKERYLSMLDQRVAEGKKYELPEDFVRTIFNHVHEESLNLQLNQDSSGCEAGSPVSVDSP